MTDDKPDDVALAVSNLHTTIGTGPGAVRGVDGVSFTVRRGEIFGIAGESGSGKSMTAFSILRLLPTRGRISEGSILFKGEELTTLSEAGMRKLRGDRIAMIFQDPMTSLNPVFTVGSQISEAILQHRRMSATQAQAEAIRLMEIVEIPDAASRYSAFPHQFSGGMRQRIMIAMALSCAPDLLIADEPTTALDVTVEKQIIGFLQKLRRETGVAIMLITHNLNLLAENSDRIAIMYAGQIVELAPTSEIFANPRHPYTQALLNSMPRGHISQQRLVPLAGVPPRIVGKRSGCSFAPRCPMAQELCTTVPELRDCGVGHSARCWFVEGSPRHDK
ncbi:MAG: ABC transporter ATP-binding protein [Pararhodobacter sp.]|nr:ABC transporter ATP-binding protein [Pararhodobacter sp.]